MIDGREISYSSLPQGEVNGTASIFDLRLHVLADGDRFDLQSREPIPHSTDGG